ncbi:hypothetical protein N7516_011322 [Penicillium verrucosum]|uniref:uncharacterized protein n=1 Tax=Penicillium verrucosum TaxID=60171 RepID=UPI002544E929|nr:uncharacterized protein N7516_011322 [Penicillium verrucosum]KAJ5920464.1 hypothetical protein N7516_011322 [Penicillium verrucosum]
MHVIGVAGASGGVGKAIVERLAQEPKYQVIAFSRSKPSSNHLLPNVQSVQLNYDDVPSMTETLAAFNVHTIISAIVAVTEETSQAQLNLIDAAGASTKTERFIPSEFLFIQPPAPPYLDPVVHIWIASIARIKMNSLQYTRIVNGLFMDYWGMPHVPTSLIPHTFGINIGKREAVIPGDGNNIICMTLLRDMTNYLVKLLDIEEWPEFSVFVGDELSYNQMVKIAEEVTGTKFKVTYDSVENANSGNVALPPMPSDTSYSPEEQKGITAQVAKLVVNDVLDFPKDIRLNDRFPEVQPIKFKEFLNMYWAGEKA